MNNKLTLEELLKEDNPNFDFSKINMEKMVKEQKQLKNKQLKNIRRKINGK